MSREAIPIQYNYADGLNKTIVNAIEHYTDGAYTEIHELLSTKRNLGRWQETVDALDIALMGSPPLTKPIVVFRGINANEFINSTTGFVSTSYDINQALDNTGKTCCLLEIEVPIGSRILPVQMWSGIPDEAEILLPRNSTFYIKSVSSKKLGGGYNEISMYNLMYIPDGWVPVTPKNKPPTKQDVIEALSTDDWANRIYQFAIEEVIDFGSTADQAVNDVLDTIFSPAKHEIPHKAILIAKDRIASNLPS